MTKPEQVSTGREDGSSGRWIGLFSLLDRLLCAAFFSLVRFLGAGIHGLHRRLSPEAAWQRRVWAGQHAVHTLVTRDTGTYGVGLFLHLDRETLPLFPVDTDHLGADLSPRIERVAKALCSAYAEVNPLCAQPCVSQKSTPWRTAPVPCSYPDYLLVLEGEPRRMGRRRSLVPGGGRLFRNGQELQEAAEAVRSFETIYNRLVGRWDRLDNHAFRALLERDCAVEAHEQGRFAAELFFCPKVLLVREEGRSLPRPEQPVVGPGPGIDCTTGALGVLVVRVFSDGLWIELRETGHATAAIPRWIQLAATVAVATGKARIAPGTLRTPGPAMGLRRKLDLPTRLHLWCTPWLHKGERDANRQLTCRILPERPVVSLEVLRRAGRISFTGAYAVLVAAVGGFRTLSVPVSFPSRAEHERPLAMELYKYHGCAGQEGRGLLENMRRCSAELAGTLQACNPSLAEQLFIEYLDPRGWLTHGLERLLGGYRRLATPILSDGTLSNIFPIRPYLSLPGLVVDETLRAPGHASDRLDDALYAPHGGLFSTLGKRGIPFFDPSQVALSGRTHTRGSIGIAPEGGGGPLTMLSFIAPLREFDPLASEAEPAELGEACYLDFDPGEVERLGPRCLQVFFTQARTTLLSGPRALVSELESEIPGA